jgi:Carboxypeptidase regulatory-like domain
MRRLTLGVAALAVGAWGCGGKSADNAGAGGAASSGGAVAQSGTSAGATGNSTVSGVIHFTGAAPTNPKIDMSQESACQGKYTAPPTDPQYVIADGKLGNVFVYVDSGVPNGAKYAPPAPVTIDQNGCLYHPRIFGAMVGQDIIIKNSDNVLHNIKAVPKVNRGFNISQPSAGMTSKRSFASPEVMVPLECNVHGWMHAYVGVLPHPFFATSGTDGTFSLKNLPAGTYTIKAWHEKLGTQQQTVTVGAGETKTVDFTFSGPKA